MKVSLGLLPSGPDPVGEEHVRANLPKRYMRIKWGKRKASGGEEFLQYDQNIGQDGVLDHAETLHKQCLVDGSELFGENKAFATLELDGDTKSGWAAARR